MLTSFGAVYRYDDYDGTEPLNRAATRTLFEVTPRVGGRSAVQPHGFGTNVYDSKFRLERVRPPVSDEELVADIRRAANLAGTNVISFRLYRKSGNYDPT